MIIFILSYTQNSDSDNDIQEWFFNIDEGIFANMTGVLLVFFEYYQLAVTILFLLFLCCIPVLKRRAENARRRRYRDIEDNYQVMDI